jgi:hypothetical protein
MRAPVIRIKIRVAIDIGIRIDIGKGMRPIIRRQSSILGPEVDFATLDLEIADLIIPDFFNGGSDDPSSHCDGPILAVYFRV